MCQGFPANGTDTTGGAAALGRASETRFLARPAPFSSSTPPPPSTITSPSRTNNLPHHPSVVPLLHPCTRPFSSCTIAEFTTLLDHPLATLDSPSTYQEGESSCLLIKMHEKPASHRSHKSRPCTAIYSASNPTHLQPTFPSSGRLPQHFRGSSQSAHHITPGWVIETRVYIFGSDVPGPKSSTLLK